ncbi:hypothetical protein FHX42_004124 [Saccharopolyspora lacisalsi]|uniref:DUF2537 domain-containing protein n=1 Tax=Halosaccharopolyspora lacisalsi TaxID=1000566 RepID=A0A839E4J7_9PSEU|nr:DUF2537 domain-containing protein [Halosaccharopolyspora lacisalsi]MBA8826745.1 hypothetical protein [Halosaccharopolyspora lacisalsi]
MRTRTGLTKTGQRKSSGIVELRVSSGRAVLLRDGNELDPRRLRLSAPLVAALREWASVVEEVADESTGQAVSRRGRQLAGKLAEETGEVRYVDPLDGRVRRVGGQRAAASAPEEREAAEPVPWGTGLTVSAIVAAIVAVAMVVVSAGMAEVSILLAAIVNIVVAAGFAPSIWIGRRVLVWRWVALGTASGIALAWCALLLGLLG